MRSLVRFEVVLALVQAACASPSASARAPQLSQSAPAAAAATAGVPVDRPEANATPPIAWTDLAPTAFARARTEGRLVLIDGSAEWCHWCHVMDATTYSDPAVRALVAERFVPVRVDVDERPDFEERYRESGWPATVLLTADGAEIARYKGYQAPAKLLDVLREALRSPPPSPSAIAAVAEPASGAAGVPSGVAAPTPARRLSEAEVATASAETARTLDEIWDAREGGWGGPQKLPLAWNNAWALGRAARGDKVARERALFVLDQQRKIIDPVWGGLCQYSTDGDWLHPHFEKLIAVQAGAIDNYATAFAITRDAAWLTTARKVRAFVDGFMTSPEGGFYATMDADLNAHDASRALVSGHDYYARGDRERRALGIPRIDRHEYPRENGLVIAAYATLGEVAKDSSATASAERAVARILATHGTARGGLTHDQGPAPVLYLADNAAFGFGLVRLYEVTRAPAYLDAAHRVAAFLTTELARPGGGFLTTTANPAAVGVFAERRTSFEDNVMAIRFLARLARAESTDAYRDAVAGALAVVGTRDAIAERGRIVGDFLLAVEETAERR